MGTSPSLLFAAQAVCALACRIRRHHSGNSRWQIPSVHRTRGTEKRCCAVRPAPRFAGRSRLRRVLGHDPLGTGLSRALAGPSTSLQSTRMARSGARHWQRLARHDEQVLELVWLASRLGAGDPGRALEHWLLQTGHGRLLAELTRMVEGGSPRAA